MQQGLGRLLEDEPALTLRVLTDPRGRVQSGIVTFVEALLGRDIAEFGLVRLGPLCVSRGSHHACIRDKRL